MVWGSWVWIVPSLYIEYLLYFFYLEFLLIDEYLTQILRERLCSAKTSGIIVGRVASGKNGTVSETFGVSLLVLNKLYMVC